MMMRGAAGVTSLRARALAARLPSLITSVLAIAAALALSACGFALRGTATLPYESVVIESPLPIKEELIRAIEVGTTTKVLRSAPLPNPDTPPQVIVELIGETLDKTILSLNSVGQPREYRLFYRLSFRVRDDQGGEYIPPTTLSLHRDLTFNLLVGDLEEGLLYRDMRTDMVGQVLRRMRAAKLRPRED